jgi:signal transduction histidine kinase
VGAVGEARGGNARVSSFSYTPIRIRLARVVDAKAEHGRPAMQNRRMGTPIRRLLRSRSAWPTLLVAVALGITFNEWLYRRASSGSAQYELLVDVRGEVNRLLLDLAALDTSFRTCLRLDVAESCAAASVARDAVSSDAARLDARLSEAFTNDQGADLGRAVADRLTHVDRGMATRLKDGAAAAAALLDAPSRPPRSTEWEIPIGRRFVDAIDAQARDASDRARHGLLAYRFGVVAVTLLCALGVVLFRRQLMANAALREQRLRELAHEHEQLGALVDERTRELHELARHLQTAREDERHSLARELHDEMGALLTAAKMDLARMRSKVPLNDEGKQRLQHLSSMLDQGILLKRRIIEDLHPSALDGLGLLSALQSLCVAARERMGVTFDVSLDPAVQLGKEASLAIYRFVQESLTNIAKYASARHVSLRARVEGDLAVFEIADDGRGFDVNAVGVGRHGLRGMRFRIASLGGDVTITSRPGEGALLRASLRNGVQPDTTDARAAPVLPSAATNVETSQSPNASPAVPATANIGA